MDGLSRIEGGTPHRITPLARREGNCPIARTACKVADLYKAVSFAFPLNTYVPGRQHTFAAKPPKKST